MSFNWRGYASTLWSRIKDSVVQDATRDQAEKVNLLARDLYLYVKQLEDKLALQDEKLSFLNGGVVIIVTGSACPTGWTEDTTWRNRFLQGPDAAGGNIGTTGAESITIASGGSHSHVISGHNHTISTDGTHYHQLVAGTYTFNAGTGSTLLIDGNWATYNAGAHNHGGYTGTSPDITSDSAGSHSHTGSNITPAFKRALFCKKVA